MRRPRSAHARWNAPVSIHCGSTSNETMFVTTVPASMRIPRMPARPSARERALRWSSTRRSRISSSPTSAAAAMTPACRIAPPRSLRTRRAFATVSALPQRIEPTGAERPFEKQNCTLSAGAEDEGGAHLVLIDVREVAEDDLVAALGLRQDAAEVAEHPARDVDRGLLAEDLGGPLFEPVHGRILAVLVVADLGLRHRAAHRGRREREGVAP